MRVDDAEKRALIQDGKGYGISELLMSHLIAIGRFTGRQSETRRMSLAHCGKKRISGRAEEKLVRNIRQKHAKRRHENTKTSVRPSL